MQPRQQSPGYGSLLNTVNSGLMQMQNTPAYDSPSVRLHEQRIANIQNQADAASNVYNQMGQPRVGSQFAQNRAAGFQTDQYGRQYQMTPQMAGTAMPTGGAGAWMQGRSLSGAPAGVYVQSNLPAPAGGMERVAAGMSGQRPSAFAGMAGGVTGRATYEAMRARRQQQADQRIVARARIRGLGQNTPAVRMAMQRLGMLNPTSAQPPMAPGQTTPTDSRVTSMPGSAKPVLNAPAAVRIVDRLSKDQVVLTALQGVEPGKATIAELDAAIKRTSDPAAVQRLRELAAARLVADPELAAGDVPGFQRMQAYDVGGPASYAAAERIQNTPAAEPYGGSYLANERAKVRGLRVGAQESISGPLRSFTEQNIAQPVQQNIVAPARSALYPYQVAPSIAAAYWQGLGMPTLSSVGQQARSIGQELKKVRPRVRR